MKRLIGILIAAAALAACSSNEVKNAGSITEREFDSQGKVVKEHQERSDYAAYLDRASAGAQSVKLTCPATGCIIGSLEIPLNASGEVKVAPPAVPKSASTAFIDGMFSLGHDFLGLAPWYFGAKVLTTAFDKANSSVTTTTTNTAIDNSNRSVDNSNRSVITTTTTTDASNHAVTTTNSNNRTCTSGAPTGTTGQTGSSGQTSC